MKRIFGIMLLVCVVLFLTSCFNFGPTPDSENGVVKIRIRNPNYGISAAAIPVETDSFVVLIKGFSSSTPVVFDDSFGNREYIEFSIKLPGDKTYGFYLMGSAGGRMTCFGSIKDVFVRSGENTQLQTQMKSINISFKEKGTATDLRIFQEPNYGTNTYRFVNWAREYYVFTCIGEGLGDFFSEASSGVSGIFTGYEFDIWNGQQFFLSSEFNWYSSTETYIYSIGETLKRADSNTLRADVPVFFPMTYAFAGSSVYKYEWGKFTFYVPVSWGGKSVAFRQDIFFSELGGNVQIVVE